MLKSHATKKSSNYFKKRLKSIWWCENDCAIFALSNEGYVVLQ
jgi:hypothetical protein